MELVSEQKSYCVPGSQVLVRMAVHMAFILSCSNRNNIRNKIKRLKAVAKKHTKTAKLHAGLTMQFSTVTYTRNELLCINKVATSLFSFSLVKKLERF